MRFAILSFVKKQAFLAKIWVFLGVKALFFVFNNIIFLFMGSRSGTIVKRKAQE